MNTLQAGRRDALGGRKNGKPTSTPRLASLFDSEAKAGPIKMPDGSSVKRLPQKDIEDAQCAVLLLTDQSVGDPSVYQRCEMAYGASKQLFAIQLDPVPPGALVRFIGTTRKLLWRPGRDDLQRVLRLLTLPA